MLLGTSLPNSASALLNAATEKMAQTISTSFGTVDMGNSSSNGGARGSESGTSKRESGGGNKQGGCGFASFDAFDNTSISGQSDDGRGPSPSPSATIHRDDSAIILTASEDDDAEGDYLGMRKKKVYMADSEDTDTDEINGDEEEEKVHSRTGSRCCMKKSTLILVVVAILLIAIFTAVCVVFISSATQRSHWSCPPINFDFSFSMPYNFCNPEQEDMRIVTSHGETCDRLDTSHTELVCDFSDSNLVLTVPRSKCTSCSCMQKENTEKISYFIVKATEELSALSIVLQSATIPRKCRLFFWK